MPAFWSARSFDHRCTVRYGTDVSTVFGWNGIQEYNGAPNLHFLPVSCPLPIPALLRYEAYLKWKVC